MSYTWLLHKLLCLLKLNDYLKFIKILKCPKRTASYESNFAEIMLELHHSSMYGAVVGAFLNYAPQHAEYVGGRCPPPSPMNA